MIAGNFSIASAHELARGLLQILGATVIAEAGPHAQNALLWRPSQRLDGRKCF
jgi:hypothetical protein